MNLEEKVRIKELREEGMGYTKIAKKMDISVNTIKSFCRRTGIGGIRSNKKEINPCKFCGKSIQQISGRKKKKFCSNLCRNKWWNTHMEEVDRKANYECVCQNCGKFFISYGNRNRKYCSHGCYITSRFGGGENESD